MTGKYTRFEQSCYLAYYHYILKLYFLNGVNFFLLLINYTLLYKSASEQPQFHSIRHYQQLFPFR